MKKQTSRKTRCPARWYDTRPLDWKLLPECDPGEDPRRIAASVLQDSLGRPVYARFTGELIDKDNHEVGLIRISLDANPDGYYSDLFDNAPHWELDIEQLVKDLISDHCIPHIGNKIPLDDDGSSQEIASKLRELAGWIDDAMATSEETEELKNLREKAK